MLSGKEQVITDMPFNLHLRLVTESSQTHRVVDFTVGQLLLFLKVIFIELKFAFLVTGAHWF